MRTLVVLSALAWLAGGTAAASECTLDEVLGMYGAGFSLEEVDRECGSRVSDSRCSARRVERLLELEPDDEAVYRRCVEESRHASAERFPRLAERHQPSVARMCVTPALRCPMRVALVPGSYCECWIYGRRFPGGVAR